MELWLSQVEIEHENINQKKKKGVSVMGSGLSNERIFLNRGVVHQGDLILIFYIK